jgi:hypothetical protein
VSEPRATGRCLCGAVRYEVRGPLRDILICHCVECRRWSGHLGAFSAAREDDLVLRDDGALRWIDSPESDRRARRGFCGECGSGLFWRAADGDRIHIAAGTLDRPTGLQVAGHFGVPADADWDEPRDGLSREIDSSELRWS